MVARTLGRVGFGELGIIHSTLALFQLFAGFGLGVTTTKCVAEHRQRDPLRAGRVIGMAWMVTAVTGGVCAVLLAVLAPWLAAHTLAAPHLSGLLRITAIGLFISALNAAQNGALSGFEAFKTIATRNLIAGVISFPVMITGVLLAGLRGAVWATVVSSGANWFICHFAVRHEANRFGVPLTFSGCMQELPLLWKFSLPAVLSALMVTPVNWACNAVFVNQADGYANLGVFAAAVSMSVIVVTINAMLGQVLLPMTIALLDKGNNRFDFLNFALPWAIGIAFALPIMVFPEVGGVVFGRGYAGDHAERTVLYVMFYTLIIAHRQSIARNFVARSYMWYGVFSNLFWGTSALVFAYVFRSGGAEGRAGAFLLAYVLNTVIFIPFYLSRSLCARNLLISLPSILIWAIIVLVFLLMLASRPPVIVRIPVLLCSYGLIIGSFRALWRLHAVSAEY